MRKCETCSKKEVHYIGEGDFICTNCGQEYGFEGSVRNTASERKYWGRLNEDPKRKPKA